VLGARNRDWEDLAAFTWRDRNWIVIGDIGDNAARRRAVRLHLLPEPGPEDTTARPVASLTLMYPDGPRDAEGLAVDATTGTLYVLSKRDRPNRLYQLPLYEAWLDALQRLTPLADHNLSQAEAITFNRAGSAVIVTSEGELAPLITQAVP